MRALSAIVAFAAVSAVAAASDVVDLTKDSFPGFISKEKLALVEFFAPWCGHCKALAPEYETAATELKSSSIPLAKVDCTVETELCEKEGVRGYPTLKVFREGSPKDYGGARKADGIIAYMKKQALPALSVLEAEKVEEFSKTDKVVVVGFFDAEKGEEYETYKAVSESLRDDFVFGLTLSADAAKAQSVEAPAVVLFKQFDEGKVTFSGKYAKEDLTDFVKSNSIPLMDEIGPENYGNYVERGLPIAYLFYSNDEEKTSLGAQIEKVAANYKGKVSFVYIDANKYGGHGQSLNLKAEWPAFAVQDPAKNLKWPYDQDKKITSEAIEEFVTKVLDGSLSPSIKSAPVPEKNDEPVKVVVGSTYEDVVLDKSKDVFIELYAPWCGHCKKLAPIWDELAEKLKENEDIVIAKMDGTENDIPANSPFRLEGFPTLKLYKANSNEIVDYQGNRDLESLLDFVKSNAVHGTGVKAEVDEDKSGADHDEL